GDRLRADDPSAAGPGADPGAAGPGGSRRDRGRRGGRRVRAERADARGAAAEPDPADRRRGPRPRGRGHVRGGTDRPRHAEHDPLALRRVDHRPARLPGGPGRRADDRGGLPADRLQPRSADPCGAGRRHLEGRSAAPLRSRDPPGHPGPGEPAAGHSPDLPGPGRPGRDGPGRVLPRPRAADRAGAIPATTAGAGRRVRRDGAGMTGTVAAAAGMLVGLGVFAVVLGLQRRWDPPARGSGPVELWARLTRRPPGARGRRRDLILAGSLAAGLVVALVTGWLIAIPLAPVLVFGLPYLLILPKPHDVIMLEALDRWVRSIAATLSTGRSITDAIRTSRRTAPPVIAEPLGVLVGRLN